MYNSLAIWHYPPFFLILPQVRLLVVTAWVPDTKAAPPGAAKDVCAA